MSLAVSYVLTPSAIKSSAWARRATRSSVFPGRIAASTAARCSRDSDNGFAGGPGRARATHGPESIMDRGYSTPTSMAKFLADGTSRVLVSGGGSRP